MYTMLITAASFAVGVALTMLFGSQIATLVMEREAAAGIGVRGAILHLEDEIKGTLEVVEERVHGKLDALRSDLDKAADKL